MFQAVKRFLSRSLSRPPTSANTAEAYSSADGPVVSISGFHETLLSCDGAELCVRTFGSPTQQPVVCWHGFARTGTDFCSLATALAANFFVICPDTPGRGLSGWLAPSEYSFTRYQRIAQSLIRQLAGGRRVHWIGTSMGGALGMMLAANPQTRHLIDHLVLNDIGPEVPEEALERIRSYTGEPQSFRDYAEARQYFESIYAPFGELSIQEWNLLLLHSLRRDARGLLTQHYDPAILSQFGEQQNTRLAWALFASITAPMLVIRGTESDVLTAEIADRMVASALRVERLDVPNVGHAPFLNQPDQIQSIQSFIH